MHVLVAVFYDEDTLAEGVWPDLSGSILRFCHILPKRVQTLHELACHLHMSSVMRCVAFPSPVHDS